MLWQDAQSAYHCAHSTMNSLSDGVTSDLVNLHSSLGGSGTGS